MICICSMDAYIQHDSDNLICEQNSTVSLKSMQITKESHSRVRDVIQFDDTTDGWFMSPMLQQAAQELVPRFTGTQLEHFNPACVRKPSELSPRSTAIIPNLGGWVGAHVL